MNKEEKRGHVGVLVERLASRVANNNLINNFMSTELNAGDEFLSLVKPDLFLVVGENATDEDMKISVLFESMAIYRVWSEKWVKKEFGELSLDEKKLLINEASVVGEMYLSFRDWFMAKENVESRANTFFDNRKKMVDLLGDAWKYPDSAVLVEIEEIRKAPRLWPHKLRHDAGTPMGIIIGNAQFCEFYDDVSDDWNTTVLSVFTGVGRLKDVVEHGIEYVKERIFDLGTKREAINSEELKFYVQDNLSSTLALSLPKMIGGKQDLPSVKVGGEGSGEFVWSYPWLDILFESVATNSVKFYMDRLDKDEDFGENLRMSVVVENYSDETGDFLDLIFEDNGSGFDEEIIKEGFREGVTKSPKKHGGGTGYGIVIVTENLPEGGQIIPQRRTDGEGSVIPGARLVVRLPKVNG